MGKKFIVQVREVHINSISVEADSPEDAIDLVRDGDADDSISLEYSHTLDPDNWSVEEDKR